MAAAQPVDTISLSGVRIARLTREEVVTFVGGEMECGRGGWVITTNVDHMQRCRTDGEVRELYDLAELVVADGVPLLWAARLQGSPLPDRVAGSDLVWLLAAHAAETGRSLYLLGGAPGSAEATAARLCARWPTLRIVGHGAPMISAQPTPEECDAVACELAREEPDLVYVALGAPKQERLIAALRDRFPRTWWIGVGISFSFIAEQVQRAPVWMQRSGLEWLHRLAQEPRRLARRYLIDDLPFLLRLLIESWRVRSSRSDVPLP